MSEPAAAPPIRPIVLLSAAAFASAATLRVADPLLPQIAGEFVTTAGGASVIATYFAVSYGLCQIFVGALGDRFGKYTVIAAATLLSGLTAGAGAFAGSLAMLGALRLLSGATAGAIIPLAIAYLGDVVAYEQRQTALARFLSGQILGVIFGQVFGGLFGDTIGWRGVFIVLGAIYLVIAALLAIEIKSPRVAEHRQRDGGALITRNLALLRIPRVRIVILTAFIEAFFFFGGFVYLGAYLRHEFALSYLNVGLLLAAFGVGGLIYAAAVRPLVTLSANAASRWLAASRSPSPSRLPRRRRRHGASPRRSPSSAPGSTCCTTRCRPTQRRWRRMRAALLSRSSPSATFSARRPASPPAAGASTRSAIGRSSSAPG